LGTTDAKAGASQRCPEVLTAAPSRDFVRECAEHAVAVGEGDLELGRPRPQAVKVGAGESARSAMIP